MQKVSFFSRLHPFGTQGKISRKKAGIIAILMGILVISLSLLASRSSSDFGTLYQRHARAQVATLESIARDFGVFRQQQIEGSTSLALQLPVIFSGALNFNFLSQIDGKDGSFSAKNLGLNFESMVSSGSLSLEELKILSLAGNSFFFFKNLEDAGFMTPEMKKVFDTYNNSWLAWTREDVMKSLSGATPEEQLSFTVTENISKMSLKDLENYLTDFPLLTAKEDLGMSGTLHMFQVELDRKNTLALAEKLARDLTQSGMTDIGRENFKNSLDAMNLSGTVGFHESNPEESIFSLTLSTSGGEVLGTFEGKSAENHRSLTMISPTDDTRASLSFDTGEDQANVKLILSQSGAEVANANFVLTRQAEQFKSLTVTVTAQGVTASLSHEMKDDKGFEGRLTLPVGALTWTGNMLDGALDGLSVKGVIPDATLSMNLAKSGALLVGPLSIISLGEEVLRANIELEIRKGIFGFIFDIPTVGGTSGAKLNIRTIYDITDFNGTIKRPSPTRPLDEFFQALEQVMPSEEFVEVPQVTEPVIVQ